MLTTCPECQTTFRVTQEHLGLRRGLVRCGHCGVVFNAYDSLLAELLTPPEEADTHEPPATLSRDSTREAQAPELLEPATVAGPPATRTPSAEPAPAPPDSPPAAQATPPVEAAETITVQEPVAGRPPPARPVKSEIQETSESILLSELPTRARRAARAARARVLLPRLAAVFLIALLLLQMTLFLRADIAAALPAARPLLQSLCQPLGCLVALPRQLDKTAIAASSLEHDAENKSRARLSLLLANREKQAQTWPYIVLILTDVRDAPVAQRVFAPEEYLAPGSRLETGMAAGEEQEIRLDLDTGTLAATGYALDLAYR